LLCGREGALATVGLPMTSQLGFRSILGFGLLFLLLRKKTLFINLRNFPMVEMFGKNVRVQRALLWLLRPREAKGQTEQGYK